MKAKSVEEKSFYIILWQGKDGIICFGCVKEYVGEKKMLEAQNTHSECLGCV